MSEMLKQVKDPIARGVVRVSDHGYDRLAADGILVRDVPRGVPRGATGPAVLVTAYRPEPARWTGGLERRRP